MGPSTERPGIVPFPRFFAVFGFVLVSLLLVVILLETGSWVFLSLYWNYWHSPLRRLQAISPPGRYPCRGTGNGGCPVLGEGYNYIVSASPAFDGYAWAEDLWKEFRAYESLNSPPPYEPFRLWGMAKYHGTYINNDDVEMGRVRRTINEPRPGCVKDPALKVWFFGGSTAWGEVVPDFATIPSYLSEKLNARHTGCVQVTNLGVDAYDSNQELIYLVQELKAGWRPNVVIFYDGINDTVVGMFDPAIASTHLSFTQIKAKFESPLISWPGLARRSHLAQFTAALRKHFLRSGTPQHSHERWASLAERTLSNYEGNLQLARALGRAYGFDVYAFWQPTLSYGNKPLDPFERMLVGPANDSNEGYQAVYEAAERRAASTGDFVFLGRLFEGVSGPLYIDWAHLGPRGNEMVAGAIVRALSSAEWLHGGKHPPGLKN